MRPTRRVRGLALRLLNLLVLTGLLWSMIGCDPESRAPPASMWMDPSTIPPVIDCALTPDQLICRDTWSAQCGTRGAPSQTRNCGLENLTCVPELGCRVCAPSGMGCTADNELYRCDEAGNSYEVLRTCDVGTVCSAIASNCIDLCAAAEESKSYIGCDYWAVTTSNSQLDATFEFEIAIANPQNIDADITIERGNEEPIHDTVAPGEVVRIALPWVDTLVNRDFAQTRHVSQGAYHILSSVPVTVTQFNPMEFQNSVTESYTNDASLLLPSHVLTGNYIVVSRPALVSQESGSGEIDALPGFVAITAVDDDVEVRLTSSAYVQQSIDGTVPALEPGSELVMTLTRGDVLQLVTDVPTECPTGTVRQDQNGNDYTLCTPDAAYDLTGTTIRANGRVSVIAGHDCAYIPFDKPACDHLEEELFPEESLGTRIPVSLSAAIDGVRDSPDLVVVVSAHDDNHITFTPPVHEDVTLQRGERVELIADEDFVVEGTEALSAAQFLVGQNYDEASAFTGDPAMALAIPDAQWRTSYDFLIPTTYEHDFINVIAPIGAPVTLDDIDITPAEWTEIEGTSFYTAKVRIWSGQHHIHAGSKFGITLYGYALYTSYMVPGGLDFYEINAPE